LPQD